MKRKNLAKKLTAMLMTGAMVMSMGMTAFGASTGVIEGTNGEGLTKISLTKVISEINDSSVVEYAPRYTFKFNIEGTNEYTNLLKPDINPENKDLPIYKGPDEGVVKNVEIPFTEVSTNSNAKRKTGDITLNPNGFTTPGIYRYKVTEEDINDYDGLKHDSTVYFLDVYVIDKVESTTDFEPQIQYVVVSKYNTDKKQLEKADLVFDNKYTTSELTITKKVTGNQGDKTKDFGFSVTIKAAGEIDERYNVYVDGKMVNVDYSTPGEASFTTTLKHDGIITVTGLSANDSYTIEETTTGDGYTTTITGDGQTDASNQYKRTGAMNTDGTAADKAVTYENNKKVDTPTGIAMTFAPYIAMVAFAGVFAVMFLRKKREDF